MRALRAPILLLVLAAAPQLAPAQAAVRAAPSELAATALVSPRWARVKPPAEANSSHLRATVIGATAGGVLGGLGSAAIILNALAPNCVTAISGGQVVSSSHCAHRSRIVIVETVTIVAGTGVGAFGGGWIARRFADWRGHRQRDPSPDQR